VTINQTKGCIRRIADRLDLTLECIRRYYKQLADAATSSRLSTSASG
jgi:hypothetical protein